MVISTGRDHERNLLSSLAFQLELGMYTQGSAKPSAVKQLRDAEKIVDKFYRLPNEVCYVCMDPSSLHVS